MNGVHALVGEVAILRAFLVLDDPTAPELRYPYLLIQIGTAESLEASTEKQLRVGERLDEQNPSVVIGTAAEHVVGDDPSTSDG